jgi:hypothetical protein
VVGERQLRAGVGALAADEHPRSGRPGRQVELVGDLADLSVGTLAVDRRDPALIGDLKDRRADGLGQVIADREPDPCLPRPVQQLMAGARAVDPEQQLDRFDVLGGYLRDRLLGDHDLISGGFAPALPGRSSPASASPV